MLLRFFLNSSTFISVLFFPWWFTIGFILLLLVSSRAYEAIFWGFMLDALYGAPVPRFMDFPALFTIVLAFLFLTVEFIKPSLVFYER